MLYSFFVLLFGVYLGQEFTLPSVKLLAMSLVGQKDDQNLQPSENVNNNYIERFIGYFLNNQND